MKNVQIMTLSYVAEIVKSFMSWAH